jgi:hypothetical protein
MGKPWPYHSDTELRAASYRFDRTETCKGPNCRQEIEFWWTPGGKRIPLDPGTMEPHFATCVDVDRFRREK